MNLKLALDRLYYRVSEENGRSPEYFYLSEKNLWIYFEDLRNFYRQYCHLNQEMARNYKEIKDIFSTLGLIEWMKEKQCAMSYNDTVIMIDFTLDDMTVRAMSTRPVYRNWLEKIAVQQP